MCTKSAVKTLHVSLLHSHTQAAQCKVVMHPDGSVTRCLVCPAAADGPGPALCLPDCCTTERIRIPHIHRQQSALLCRRILYEGLTHIFFPQFVIQVKRCSLAVDGSCGEKPYRHVRAHLACSTCSLSGFLPVAGSSLGVNHRGASWSNSQRVRAQSSLKLQPRLQTEEAEMLL